MAGRVTLKDVAREAGVHTSTASRALNPATRSVVNPETVEKVLAVARRLGYRPHPLARGLRTNQTMTIGMVIPDIENPIFGPLVAGAESVFGAGGYSVLITNVDRGGNVKPLVATLLERRVDGLVLATALREDEVVSELRTQGIPTVLVNRTTDEYLVPSIVVDDQAGVGLAVRHLVGLGHRRIGHVAGPRHLSTGWGRYQGFFGWMQSLGLDVSPEQVEEAEWFQVEPGYRAAQRLLERMPDLTAIVAGNDLIGLGCYRAIRERGKEVGRDVSVTGYNDIALLDLMQPPMTSVRVPFRRMGEEAAKLLLGLLSGERSDAETISVRLQPILSVRSSTAPPPDQA
jgi:LacI family transcriptional regulator